MRRVLRRVMRRDMCGVMRHGGFTLIELLVVMAVLALVLLVVPPMFSGSLSRAELGSAAREVAAGLREARSRAIARNREVVFTLDVESRRYRIGDEAAARRLPAGPRLALFTARSEQRDEISGNIRFFPDGSSTGGRVTLGDDARRYHVAVDWLTGQVSITD